MTVGDGAGAPRAFSCHRGIAPILWVLVALSAVELAVVHLLLALLAPAAVAVTVSALTLAGVAVLVSLVLSLRRHPVLVGADGLVWRVAWLRRLDVPWTSVRGLVPVPDGAALKARDVASYALVAHPNVAVALDPPVPGRRGPVRLLAHRLDDPAGFVDALHKHARA